MREDQPSFVCVGCGAPSPPVETEYTLISSRFGWRLTRRVKNGQTLLEWRCPSCWQRYKQDRQLAMTPVDGTPIADDGPPSSGSRKPRGRS